MVQNVRLEVMKYEKWSAYDLALVKRKEMHPTGNLSNIEVLASIRDKPLDQPGDDMNLMRLWESLLVKNGMLLDENLDVFTSRIIEVPDSWWRSRKELLTVFNVLLESRGAVRNFEQEVEQYVLYVTSHTAIRDEMVGPPKDILDEVHGTFLRAYDLGKLKLTGISNNRVTATNILLSALAVIIAVISLVISLNQASLKAP